MLLLSGVHGSLIASLLLIVVTLALTKTTAEEQK